MSKNLSDDEVAELLQGDISDIEELDEGDDIQIDNLNELLNQFPDTFDVSISIYHVYIYKYIFFLILFQLGVKNSKK